MNSELNFRPEQALHHYTVSIGIGQVTSRQDFDRARPWQLVDSRPFVRLMCGVGIPSSKPGNIAHAADVLRRTLWLNRSDDQGTRFNLAVAEDGKRVTKWTNKVGPVSIAPSPTASAT